ncbi:hypothetical protein NDN08_000062 [Rhodosorus marinus]|uniref:Tyrosine-specific transport protein n=1 Tax=Rhodosorus marinus TaxID=101924 RepID=A0AAV8UJC2_9RHOD|nr:hypothetical protein NDN08_000062 [Rhodosorus marinus]
MGGVGFVTGFGEGVVRKRAVVCAKDGANPRMRVRGSSNVGGRRVRDREAEEFAGADDEQSRLYRREAKEKLPAERDATSKLIGAIALVAGTTVGAGVLALPAVTREGGFLPSTALLLGAWLYMSTTGNLIAEATAATTANTGRKEVSLLSIIELSLGKVGAFSSGAAYVGIHYALLVAYISQGGRILGEWTDSIVGGVPTWSLSLLFASAVGSLMYFASDESVEKVNNALVAGLVTLFGGLLVTVLPQAVPENLLHQDIPQAISAIPVLVLSLVFHNIVPSVVSQLDGDLKKTKTAINVGSAIPLTMFLLWNAAILGTTDASVAAYDPVEALRSGGGAISLVVSSFSLVAITTSMFGFVYGLSDFLKDLKQRLGSSGSRSEELPSPGKQVQPFLATLVPPTALALLAPDIFFEALDSAGAYGISVLFGIIPAAMVWRFRYSKERKFSNPVRPQVPGGKSVLAATGGSAAVLILSEMYQTLSPMLG